MVKVNNCVKKGDYHVFTSQITDYSIFQAGDLKNADQVVFAMKNLIIGKNGSGKTHFLKALEQEKKTQNKKEIFPFDLLLEKEENSFYDFLQKGNLFSREKPF